MSKKRKAAVDDVHMVICSYAGQHVGASHSATPCAAGCGQKVAVPSGYLPSVPKVCLSCAEWVLNPQGTA